MWAEQGPSSIIRNGKDSQSIKEKAIGRGPRNW